MWLLCQVPVKFWGQELYLRDSFDCGVHEVNVEGAEADEVFVVGVGERRSDVC